MAADVIAKLKVDAKEYDGGLAKAKKSLDQFTKQNMSLNGIMAQGLTALTKFAGGFAAAELAVKGFNKIILEGSQTTGDFVRNGVGALNDTMGILASSIATMDFTPLIRGLGDVYKQALSAREALDSLGDTLRGLGIAGSDAREAIAELREVNADSTATDEQKAKALEDANAAVKDYREVVQATITETNNWVDSSVKAMSGMRGVKTSADDVKKAVVDYAKYDSEGKKQIVENARAIQKQYEKLVDAREKLNPKYFTTVDVSGAQHRYQTRAGGSQEEIEAADRAIAQFEKDNASALRQFTLFDKMSNEAADNMAQNVSNLSEYGRGLARMEKQLKDAQKTMTATTKVTGGGGRTAATSAAEPITSNLVIEDFQKTLDGSVVSMSKLNSLAEEYRSKMASAIDPKRLGNAVKGLEDAVNATVQAGGGSIEGMEGPMKELVSLAKKFGDEIAAGADPKQLGNAVKGLEDAVKAVVEAGGDSVEGMEGPMKDLVSLAKKFGDEIASAVDEKKFDAAAKKLETIENSIKNFHIQPVEGIEKAIPSMNQLITLSKQFSDNMLNATSREQYESAAKALESVQRAIELQPIAIQAGITIDEAEQKQKLEQQFDDMRLQMKVDVELNKESLAEATGSVKTDAKDSEKSWNKAAAAISSAGNALQNIDNVGYNVAGTIMEAIANVALAFTEALKSPATTAAGVFGWIAAAAAGTATMTATIAAIKSATAGSYAQGGVVPGMPNGGFDNTYVYASPGEVILNRAQQENILSQLDDGTNGGQLSVRLNGEHIVAAINNTGRRKGWGELVFN